MAQADGAAHSAGTTNVKDLDAIAEKFGMNGEACDICFGPCFVQHST